MASSTRGCCDTCRPCTGFACRRDFRCLPSPGSASSWRLGSPISGRRDSRPSRWLVIVLAALVIEYGSAPVPLRRVTPGLPDLYRFVRGLEAGVVMEFPSSVPESLPRDDVDFQFWSTTHWKPLANGYSGYYSERYITLLERVRKFPDDRSIAGPPHRRAFDMSSCIAPAISGANTPTSCPTSPPAATSCHWDGSATRPTWPRSSLCTETCSTGKAMDALEP